MTSASTTGDAPGFEAALAGAGLVCAVEARGRLALVVPHLGLGAEARWSDPAVRQRTLALAAEHGFTHAAIELRPDAADLPPPAEGGETLRRD